MMQKLSNEHNSPIDNQFFLRLCQCTIGEIWNCFAGSEDEKNVNYCYCACTNQGDPSDDSKHDDKHRVSRGCHGQENGEHPTSQETDSHQFPTSVSTGVRRWEEASEIAAY